MNISNSLTNSLYVLIEKTNFIVIFFIFLLDITNASNALANRKTLIDAVQAKIENGNS